MTAIDPALQDQHYIEATRNWLAGFVVQLNLCPFAARELNRGSVHFTVSSATSPQEILKDLEAEITRLDDDKLIETTLLIHPMTLRNFYNYNDFLGQANDLLNSVDREGIYQIASFHPDYQFADTSPDDVENFSNRSPYPMLHILREHSLERAIASHPDTGQIPARNIALLRSLGIKKVQDILAHTADLNKD